MGLLERTGPRPRAGREWGLSGEDGQGAQEPRLIWVKRDFWDATALPASARSLGCQHHPPPGPGGACSPSGTGQEHFTVKMGSLTTFGTFK